jgi:hypothetical protein
MERQCRRGRRDSYIAMAHRERSMVDQVSEHVTTDRHRRLQAVDQLGRVNVNPQRR